MATVSAGEIGTLDFGGIFPADGSKNRMRGQVRVEESLYAPRAGGVPRRQCVNLGYPDASLRDLYNQEYRISPERKNDFIFYRGLNENPDLLIGIESPSWHGLVTEIEHLLRTSGAKTVTLPHPIIDHHPDHQYVGLAGLKAISNIPCESRPEILLYSVHWYAMGAGSNIQPVGQRDGTVSLPRLDRETPLFDDYYSHPLTADGVDRKTVALDSYRDMRDHTDRIQPPSSFLDACMRAAQDVYRYCTVYSSSFVRRFSRPNEVFFRINREKVDFWYEQFLGELTGK